MKDEESPRVHLESVEREIRQFQNKYGEFVAQLERGELGDPYLYELERDTVEWEDLVAEKQTLLKQLQNRKA